MIESSSEIYYMQINYSHRRCVNYSSSSFRDRKTRFNCNIIRDVSRDFFHRQQITVLGDRIVFIGAESHPKGHNTREGGEQNILL